MADFKTVLASFQTVLIGSGVSTSRKPLSKIRDTLSAPADVPGQNTLEKAEANKEFGDLILISRGAFEIPGPL
jgi:hypothetical protein